MGHRFQLDHRRLSIVNRRLRFNPFFIMSTVPTISSPRRGGGREWGGQSLLHYVMPSRGDVIVLRVRDRARAVSIAPWSDPVSSPVPPLVIGYLPQPRSLLHQVIGSNGDTITVKQYDTKFMAFQSLLHQVIGSSRDWLEARSVSAIVSIPSLSGHAFSSGRDRASCS